LHKTCGCVKIVISLTWCFSSFRKIGCYFCTYDNSKSRKSITLQKLRLRCFKVHIEQIFDIIFYCNLFTLQYLNTYRIQTLSKRDSRARDFAHNFRYHFAITFANTPHAAAPIGQIICRKLQHVIFLAIFFEFAYYCSQFSRIYLLSITVSL